MPVTLVGEATAVAAAKAIEALANADAKRTEYKMLILAALSDPNTNSEALQILLDDMRMDAEDRKFWSDFGRPIRDLVSG
jgi:hypothetical protein